MGKPGNLPESNAVLEIRDNFMKIYFHFFKSLNGYLDARNCNSVTYESSLFIIPDEGTSQFW